MKVGPVFDWLYFVYGGGFFLPAHSVNSIYTDHICAIYREILFILHHPQFSYLNYSPVALPSFLV
jgi:hypothetical protein